MSGRVIPLGDSCLSVVFEERIDPAVNDRCLALAASFAGDPPDGVRDVVPAFHTVAIHFDPLRVDRQALVRRVESALKESPAVPSAALPAVVVPVAYGGEDGPDLGSVAEFAGCSEADVVGLHTSAIYRVYMLGFLPGFAYLASVDPRIAMPRRDTPRLQVRAGSVGIAGEQTGVYPCNTPGGWRVIGRTALRMFDPARPDPCLLQAGRSVRFVAA